jgi:hypothetical protein
VWRRVVWQTRHKIQQTATKRGAVAIGIDSSAGIRIVRSARCEVTANTNLA